MSRRYGMGRRMAGGLSLLGVAALLAACGSSGGGTTGNSSGAGGGAPTGAVPTAHLPVLKKIGKGEGELNLIAWAGY
jgi:hypothetical protein